ncbi:lipid-A-disaccharide synthase [Thecamonas trahens ATCC 50062]|uniref:lipid-A-disaccharide synthase n=1 Tax=Thecamonas trahens ATCC 50062 TaxID=461836 RepID=A0A0L0D6G4_THETB|nr:lipid-A-disaccharide synthase [Thecamonas trahens ATCC 50062]KNC46898.1 lipid-A-disaccharide synthase [Thecamonas trahens ATCC 50062]|eukprot:XP_013760171.1 lipid-A-disaccharide synthase [Thecamonas trahens ATCC 50062]
MAAARRVGVKVALVAGEPSGDGLGAGLARALQKRGVEVVALGGPRMEAVTGVASPIPLDEVAVMGFTEVISALPRLRSHVAAAARWLAETEADIVVTVDAKGFNNRVVARAAEELVASGRPVPPRLQYVAPSLWAWSSPGRVARGAKALAASAAGVLSVVPMDAPVLAAAVPDLPVTYIGYPAVAGLLAAQRSGGLGSAASRVWAGPAERLTIGIYPGSRQQEVRVLLPLFAGVAGRVARSLGLDAADVDLHIVAATETIADRAKAYMGNEPGVEVFRASMATVHGLGSAMQRQHVALAASGTVVPQLVAMGTPTVVAFPGSWLTEHLARWLTKVSWASLPNILYHEHASPDVAKSMGVGADAPIPEFLFSSALDADGIAAAATRLLADDDARAAQLAVSSLTTPLLDGPNSRDPSELAADAVLATVAGDSRLTH